MGRVCRHVIKTCGSTHTHMHTNTHTHTHTQTHTHAYSCAKCDFEQEMRENTELHYSWVTFPSLAKFIAGLILFPAVFNPIPTLRGTAKERHHPASGGHSRFRDKFNERFHSRLWSSATQWIHSVVTTVMIISVTAGLTKQHHLIHDFAIQNICAKMFRHNTKTSGGQRVRTFWSVHCPIFMLGFFVLKRKRIK